MTQPTLLQSVKVEGKLINITFSDQPDYAFHSLWLRDNCDCSACVHVESKQKLLSVNDIAADIAPRNAVIVEGVLEVTWPDNHVSRFAPHFLAKHTSVGREQRKHQPELWDSDLTNRFPSVEYDQLCRSDTVRLTLLKQLVDFGAARVTGVSADESRTEKLASLVGIIRETPHGRIYDVKSLPEVHNLAFNSDALSLHVDGSYHYYSPGPMLFHFIETTATGGDSILVDGFAVARQLESENRDAFELLCRLPWHNAYWNHGMDLRASSPPIGRSQAGELTHIILNQYTSFPDHFESDEIEAAYTAWQHIHEIASRPSMQVRIKFPAGDALFFDNRRILHTRTAFDANAGPRRLRSCYMERDTLHSNLRVLAKKLGDPMGEAIFTTV